MAANCRINDLTHGRRYFFRACCGNVKGWGQYRTSIPNSITPSSKLLCCRSIFHQKKKKINSFCPMNRWLDLLIIYWMILNSLFVLFFRLAWFGKHWISICWSAKNSWWSFHRCASITTKWCIWNTIRHTSTTKTKSKEENHHQAIVFSGLKISKKSKTVSNARDKWKGMCELEVKAHKMRNQ